MLDIHINNHFKNYVPDIIDTRIYKSKQIIPKQIRKHICIYKFDNEVLEATSKNL